MAEVTDKPPLDWNLAGLAVLSLVLGGAAALAAGFSSHALGAALIALFVTIAALASPRELLWKAALIFGASTFAMLMLVYATAGHPLAAGLAMAAVSFLGSIIGAAGTALSAAGMLISMAYFLPAATSTTRGLSLEQAAELGLIGIAAGLLTITLILLLRVVTGQPAAEPQEAPSPAAANQPARTAIAAALRHRDSTFRYAVRRAIVLGIGMGIFQATDDHNVFWVMLTIFIVLQPEPSATWNMALQRSGGTILGALLISGLGNVLPRELIVGLAIVLMVGGLAYYRRNYSIYVAGLTAAIIALFGAPTGDFLHWGALRIGDTLIGVLIALAVGYLLLPNHSSEEPSAA